MGVHIKHRTMTMLFSRTRKFLAIYNRNKAATFALIALCALTFIGVLSPLIAPFGAFEIAGKSFVPPSNQHLLGTDDFGRDILSQLLHGSKASLIVGFLSALMSAGIGISVGAISGFIGGKTDLILMRLTEVFQVLPVFVFALVVLALFGPSFGNVIIAIGVVSWPANARVIRGEVLSIREREFVTAAKALGMGRLRIVFSEILPNAIPPVIVNTALQVASAVTAESGLGFLGLSDPRVMSWGWMLGNSRPFFLIAWWMMTFPGLCILMTVLILHFVSDGLSQVFSPERRRY